MITLILRDATDAQLYAAVHWVSDQLHVPVTDVNNTVAVAYVVQHFKAGQLEGWDGFIKDIGD